MQTLKLRFLGEVPFELSLGPGMHGIGFDAQGRAVARAEDSTATVVRFCVDRRGVWLTVGDGARGVHVNGRPVQRMAMLRGGDVVFVGGCEIVLTSTQVPGQPSAAMRNAPSDSGSDVRTLLRGVGGQYHGRSFTLDRPRLVGRAASADIRIDDDAFAERHARIECHGEAVLLRDLDSADGSLVNGLPVRDALLQPGDQVVFDAHHRFVLESPRTASQAPASIVEAALARPAAAGAALHDSARRLPWLLLAALLIAGALSALLLFGTSS